MYFYDAAKQQWHSSEVRPFITVEWVKAHPEVLETNNEVRIEWVQACCAPKRGTFPWAATMTNEWGWVDNSLPFTRMAGSSPRLMGRVSLVLSQSCLSNLFPFGWGESYTFVGFPEVDGETRWEWVGGSMERFWSGTNQRKFHVYFGSGATLKVNGQTFNDRWSKVRAPCSQLPPSCAKVRWPITPTKRVAV